MEEVTELFADVKRLWAEATQDERPKLIAPLIERAYTDIGTKAVGATTPVPAFAVLLNTRSRIAAAPASS
jgi:hypothetical protein